MAEMKYALGDWLVITSGTRPEGWQGDKQSRTEHHFLKVGTLVEVIGRHEHDESYRVKPVSDDDAVWTKVMPTLRDQHVYEDQLAPAVTPTTLSEIEEYLRA